MISLTCTKCNAELSIDDAFAGGVCRCQHCGTIQTVPKRLRPGNPASPKAVFEKKPGSSKKQPPPDVGISSGLDELAQIVASSKPGPSIPTAAPVKKRARETVTPAPSQAAAQFSPIPTTDHHLRNMLISAAILVLVLLGVVIGLLMRGR